jgi:hypothetical protein
MLFLLGREGTINLPFDRGIARLSGTWLPAWLGWLIAVGIAGTHLAATLVTRARRAGAGLAALRQPWVAVRSGALLAVLAVAVGVLNSDRGVPLTLVIFGGLVVLLDLVLRRTVFGRRVYAVGGNAEAARRAGINVPLVRVLAFALASALASLGGILAASRLAAVNQSSGGSDILLAARHPGHPVDQERHGPAQRGLLGAVHGHRRSARGSRGRRLNRPPGCSAMKDPFRTSSVLKESFMALGLGQACSSVSRLRVRAGSTGIPGPMVVLKVTFLRYRPLAADGLARRTSSSAAA